MAISLNAPFHLGSAAFLDDRMYLSADDMLPGGIDENIYPDYFFIQKKEDGSIWIYSKSNPVDPVTSKFRPLADSMGQFIQYEVMPVPDADTLGNVVQYIGETDDTYTKGYWYLCKSFTTTEDDEEITTYAWEQLDTAPQIDIEVAEESETTEGYLKTYIFKSGDKEIGRIDIPKELVVEAGSVISISINKVDEDDDSTWIYTIENTDPVQTYTKADTENEESDYWHYPVGIASTFIVLEIANQDYPIFIDAKKVVNEDVGVTTDDITSSVELGGIAAGEVIPAHTNLNDFVKKLLEKYFPSTIKLSATPTNTVVEKGESVNVSLTAVVGKKTENISKVAFYKGADLLEEITDGVTTGGTFTHSVEDAITTDITFKATSYDGKQTSESTVSYVFVNPIFTGVADDGTVDITTLSKKIETKGTTGKKYSYTSANQYIILAYPKSYNTLKSAIDQNGFDNTSSFLRSETMVGETAYYVYYTATKVTCTNFSYTFTFN